MVTTTIEHQAVRLPRKALLIKRSTLLFALGALAGYFWISPVFVPPGSAPLSGQSVERILRVLSVLLFLSLVWKRVLWLVLHESVLRLVLWVFVVAPLFSLLSYPNISFLIATVGPFIVGGLSLLCLCALRSKEFIAWVSGVGMMAAVFLGVGLSQYGLATTLYYGRARAYYGFIHPTQSAAVVLMTGIFVVLWIGQRFRKRTRMRRLLWLVTGVCAALLLFLASSRSTFLVILLLVLGAGYSVVARRAILKFLPAVILLLVPFVLFGIAVLGDTQGGLWNVLNQFSSSRFYAYNNLLSKMDQETLLSTLIGPSVYSQMSSTARGFASSESAYFSLYVNYGLVTLVSFFAFLLALSKRLSQARASLAYGCLCGVTIFFAIDSQCVTPSNLAVFLLLAYCVRCALSSSIPGKPPRSTAPVAA